MVRPAGPEPAPQCGTPGFGLTVKLRVNGQEHSFDVGAPDQDAADHVGALASLDAGAVHPLTGPVFVKGAASGDLLEIDTAIGPR